MGKTMSQFVELEKYIRICNEGDLFGEASVTDHHGLWAAGLVAEERREGTKGENKGKLV